jgi:hypothetical protein
VDDSSSFFKNASNLFEHLIDDGDIGQDDHEDLLVPIKNLNRVKVKGNSLTVGHSSRIKNNLF